jgi:hypothetical protein
MPPFYDRILGESIFLSGKSEILAENIASWIA